MRPVGESYRPLREVVAEEIRGMIVRGDLAAGERLFEDRLAEQLGVSRNPVREAIRSLEATGLVEVMPRRGAYVSTIDGDDVSKLLDVRAVLEGYAARTAAERADEDLVDALDEIIGQGRDAARAGNNVRASQLHREFHLAIERAVDNPYLTQVTQPLRHRIEMIFSLLAEERAGMSWDEHRRIRDAIAAGDADAAEQAVRHHLDEVAASIRSAP